MVHFLLLLLCAVAIYLSCEWFVNAIEWLGMRLNVGKMAVGTVLAAFGTALPESVVTLVAVTTGATPQAKDIGVGAAMGGPLALSTVAYGITGLMFWQRRRQLTASGTLTGSGALADDVDFDRLAKDQTWFLPIFVVKVALGLVAFAFKPALGLLFFAAYVVYFLKEIGTEGEEGVHDGLEPLKLQPKAANPANWAIATQTLAMLVVIFVASQLFVKQLDAVGPMLGLSGAVTALLLSPIATELPEVMNAIIWVRQGKVALSLANISGSMMIQATIPSGLGLLFTTWSFDHALVWSGVVTMIAITYLLVVTRSGRLNAVRLASAGLGYVAFVAGLVVILH